MSKEIRALLLSAVFRRLQSRNDQLLLLRCQSLKFPYAVSVTLFKLSPSAVYMTIRKREKANDSLQKPAPDSLEKPTPKLALSTIEERILMAWIESFQRNCDFPSAREVRPSIASFQRSNKDRAALRQALVANFKRSHAGQIDLVTCPRQELVRNVVVSCDVNVYSSAVLDALSRCVTPRYILNMDEWGVAMRPFKGKKQKAVILTGCPVAPRFQDIRDVSHVWLLGTISLGLQ
jgi:hypothetical protein